MLSISCSMMKFFLRFEVFSKLISCNFMQVNIKIMILVSPHSKLAFTSYLSYRVLFHSYPNQLYLGFIHLKAWKWFHKFKSIKYGLRDFQVPSTIRVSSTNCFIFISFFSKNVPLISGLLLFSKTVQYFCTNNQFDGGTVGTLFSSLLYGSNLENYPNCNQIKCVISVLNNFIYSSISLPKPKYQRLYRNLL